MKKIQIIFKSLDCEIGRVKRYNWSELHDEIVSVFVSLLGQPQVEIEKYKEIKPYGEFDMKRKTLTFVVKWDQEFVVENILTLGDNLEWGIDYKWIDMMINDKPVYNYSVKDN